MPRWSLFPDLLWGLISCKLISVWQCQMFETIFLQFLRKIVLFPDLVSVARLSPSMHMCSWLLTGGNLQSRGLSSKCRLKFSSWTFWLSVSFYLTCHSWGPLAKEDWSSVEFEGKLVSLFGKVVDKDLRAFWVILEGELWRKDLKYIYHAIIFLPIGCYGKRL